METFNHTLNSLFSQLGLPDTDYDINVFIKQNSPIPKGILLQEAMCWNDIKVHFLKEALLDDSDWAVVIDQLDARMRI